MQNILFVFISYFLSIQMSFAVNVDAIKPPDGVVGEGGTSVDFITSAISYGIWLAAVLGVIGITWWGIEMILSVWEDEKLKKARKTVIYSIVGVVVAGLAYGVVNLVGNFRLPL